MRKKNAAALVASVMAVGLTGSVLQAQTTTVFSDTLTNTTGQTGNLAGTIGDTIPDGQSWISYYSDNGGEFTPATQTLTAVGSFTSTTGGSGVAPVTPTRGSSGTNFGATDSHTNDGAYIDLPANGGQPAGTSIVTESATITFVSNAASSNPTAWGFVGLLNTAPASISAADTPPDVVANGSEEAPILAWLLVRPALGGGDYVEMYSAGGTGSGKETLATIPANDNGTWGLTHTLSLSLNTSTGVLTGTVDGVALPTDTYSTIPTIAGAILGDRTTTGAATASAPSAATLSNFSIADTLVPPVPVSWNVSASGDWNVATNWTGSTPNRVDAEADFFGAVSASTTVYANAADTVGTIHFNNSSEYLITGAGNLDIATAGGTVGLIQVDQGTDNIDLPITFSSNSTLNVASGASLIFGNPVTVSSGVSVSHVGTGTITYQSLVNIASGGSLSMTSGSLSTLSIQSGASASITANTNSVVKVSNLNIAPGGKMDINNNTLLVDYGSGSDPAATIRSEIIGGAITSSVAKTDPGQLAIGYADGGNPADRAATGVSAGEVEVKYTVAGDANLSGGVDLSDLVIVASDFGQSGADWAGGDFNYDGSVDLSDLVIVASNFGTSLSSIQSAGFSASFAAEWQLAEAEVHGSDVTLPEPGVLGLAVGAMGLISRRRRPARN